MPEFFAAVLDDNLHSKFPPWVIRLIVEYLKEALLPDVFSEAKGQTKAAILGFSMGMGIGQTVVQQEAMQGHLVNERVQRSLRLIDPSLGLKSTIGKAAKVGLFHGIEKRVAKGLRLELSKPVDERRAFFRFFYLGMVWHERGEMLFREETSTRNPVTHSLRVFLVLRWQEVEACRSLQAVHEFYLSSLKETKGGSPITEFSTFRKFCNRSGLSLRHLKT